MNTNLTLKESFFSQPLVGRIIRLFLLLIILASTAIGGIYWYRDQQKFVRESDARVVADMISVSSRVTGWITAMPTSEGDLVSAGDLLARLDLRAVNVHLVELEASLKMVGAEQEQVLAQIEAAKAQLESRLKTEKLRRDSNKITLAALNLEEQYTREEFARAEKLYQQSLIPNSEYHQAKVRSLNTKQATLSAKADVLLAETKILEIESERQELKVLAKDLVGSHFRAEEIRARIAQQKLNIENRSILSPLNGVVSRTFISVGEHVRPGQRIALVHNPDNIWIEARIRETEIRLLKVGKPVRIYVDAYPDQEFGGVVKRIGNASTSVFALLPSSNSSGNFTKVTQRLPVRISLQQRDGLLKPGMMVEVVIDIQDH